MCPCVCICADHSWMSYVIYYFPFYLFIFLRWRFLTEHGVTSYWLTNKSSWFFCLYLSSIRATGLCWMPSSLQGCWAELRSSCKHFIHWIIISTNFCALLKNILKPWILLLVLLGFWYIEVSQGFLCTCLLCDLWMSFTSSVWFQ